jgi:hypothetical protein
LFWFELIYFYTSPELLLNRQLPDDINKTRLVILDPTGFLRKIIFYLFGVGHTK